MGEAHQIHQIRPPFRREISPNHHHLMDLMGVLPPPMLWMPMLWMPMLPRDRDHKHQIRPIFDVSRPELSFDGFDGPMLWMPMLWMPMLPRDRDQKHQAHQI